MLNTFLGLLMLVSPAWLPVALGIAIVCYVLHCKRVVEPDRRLPIAVYIVAVVVCGGVGAALGVFYGAEWACSRPETGNLCGLVGFLVTGPISGTFAIVLLGLAVLRMR